MQDADAPRARRAVGRQLPRVGVPAFLTRPPLVLGTLVVAQWVVIVGIARSILHDGWLFYDGGDATWYWTSAWLVGGGDLPYASVGYAYSFLLAPFTWIAGENRLEGLPLVLVFNALVLAPLALLSVYGIARSVAGRGYAYAVAALWVAIPVLAAPYFYAGFRERYLDLALPSAVGLTGNADYPSMAFLLLGTYFLVRVFDEGTMRDALAAGLAIGFAIAIKPSTALFLPAAAVGLVLARRFRPALAVAGGLAPALLGLALWKYRSLGELPIFSDEPVALAAGLGSVPAAAVAWDRYFDVDWDALRRNLDGFREYTISRRLLQWGLVAGVIGVGRRSLPLAGLLATWLAVFLVAKGPRFSMASTSLLTHMIAAFPAVFLLLVAIPLLLPVLGERLADAGRAAARPLRAWQATATVASLGAVTALSLVAIGLLAPLEEPRATLVPSVSQYAPANAFPVEARALPGGRVRLEWPRVEGGRTAVGYAVFRGAEDELYCSPQGAGIYCAFLDQSNRAELTPVGRTREASFVDRPPPGQWVYRVAALAGPLRAPQFGDFVLLSESAAVDVPG